MLASQAEGRGFEARRPVVTWVSCPHYLGRNDGGAHPITADMTSSNQLGAAWTAKQPAEPGEVEAWSAAANRTQGGRAVGGKLYLTNRRLLFTPNFVDRFLRGRPWSVPLVDIVSVNTSPPGEFKTGPFSGSSRERLKVELRDGEIDLFVVKECAEVARRVGAALSG